MSTQTAEPRLQARAIVKSFGANRTLKGVDLTVGDGEVIGLIGENGAGKSTILNIVSGFLPYDSGSLRLDGREIAPKTYQEANRLGIFRVFQEEALHEAGVDGIDVSLPTGSLTPGQKQSVDIARVTALTRLLEVERPVVLVDEPTTALDQEHEDNFLRLLQQLRGVAAVVFVSHGLPRFSRRPTGSRSSRMVSPSGSADARHRRERTAPTDGRSDTDRELLPRTRPA